jgi:hypothetical protein
MRRDPDRGASRRRFDYMYKRLTSIVLSLLMFAGGAAADTQTRHIMQDVADSLEVLLPLSVDSNTFLDPDNRELVMEHLSRLDSSADALAEHGASQSLDFELLASAFARAARRIRANFEYLHPAEARYFLTDLTQHCVACHSRDAASGDFPLSGSLNTYLDEQPLNEREQARLQLALRQFDNAMETWEQMLSDPSVEPVDMSLDGDFVEYLTVAVRVREEFDRAARQLEQVAAREDTPFYLKRRLETWITDLKTAQRERNRDMTIERARDLFRQPDTRPGLLWNDSQLVSDLVLSAGLRDLTASQDVDIGPARLAEAYYMLGVLEARTIGLYSALPSMERFWEAAIRTAPESPYALEAYALLEESAATTFSGELPFEQTDESFARLAELRRLIGIDPQN